MRSCTRYLPKSINIRFLSPHFQPLNTHRVKTTRGATVKCMPRNELNSKQFIKRTIVGDTRVGLFDKTFEFRIRSLKARAHFDFNCTRCHGGWGIEWHYKKKLFEIILLFVLVNMAVKAKDLVHTVWCVISGKTAEAVSFFRIKFHNRTYFEDHNLSY